MSSEAEYQSVDAPHFPKPETQLLAVQGSARMRNSGEVEALIGIAADNKAEIKADHKAVAEVCEIHKKGGECDRRWREIWMKIGEVPLWAKVGISVAAAFTVVYGALGTWVCARTVDYGERLPKIETRQENVLAFLNNDLKPILEKLRETDAQTAKELAEIKAMLKSAK